ncbi:MAG: type IV pilus modification protein PilV [Acidiferrobacterales bacterium]|nr:type IV pilus modification protein PilV [Acidiferrobacterales bacterium]
MRRKTMLLSPHSAAISGRATRKQSGHKQAGASLIEVMVAFLILSIGLLGLAMLQGKSLRLNTDAYLRSQATLIAHELMENMRANPTGTYAPVTSKPGPCGCSGIAKVTNDDLIRWYDAQQTLLPFTSAEISKSGTTYTIEMNWQERGQAVKQTWIMSL